MTAPLQEDTMAEPQPDRWYPSGRRLQPSAGLVNVAVGTLLVLLNAGAGRLSVGIYVMLGLAGGLQAWLALRQRVEADERGLRIITWRTRVLD